MRLHLPDDHGHHDADAVLHPERSTTVWEAAPDDDEPFIVLVLPRAMWVDGIVLREDITAGQRIEHVVVTGSRNHAAAHPRLTEFNVVGNRRIARFAPALLDTVVVRFTQSRAAPRITGVGVLEQRPAP